MVSQPDVSSVSRYAASLKRWSVTGFGGSLLATSVGWVAVAGRPVTSEFVRFAIPISLSLFVVALGLWLRSTAIPSDLVSTVFLWSFTGSVLLGLLAGWISLLQSIGGRPVLLSASVALTVVALGALLGGLLGTYYCRLQRRTEELAQQRDRLDEFASIVSHDLRNPMNVAQGHLELARETGEDRHFEAVEDAHDRMERLVDEVLALSQRDDGTDDRTAVDLRVVAREAWSSVDTEAMDLRVETDRRVLSDGRRLRALFENLFRNAVEHRSTSPRPEDEDAVEHGSTSHQPSADDAVEYGSTSPRPEDDDSTERGSASGLTDVNDASGDSSSSRPTTGTVVVGELDDGFFVADDGPGIPPEDRELVFEGGYSTRSDGTGFGLAIVRRIAEAHDWQIRITESDVGGARFEFTDGSGQ